MCIRDRWILPHLQIDARRHLPYLWTADSRRHTFIRAFSLQKLQVTTASFHDPDFVAALRTGESERRNTSSWNAQPCITRRAVDLALTVQSALIVTEFREVFFGFLVVPCEVFIKRCFLVGRRAPTEPKNRHDGNEPTEPHHTCLLYTSPSPRDRQKSRMPSSA